METFIWQARARQSLYCGNNFKNLAQNPFTFLKINEHAKQPLLFVQIFINLFKIKIYKLIYIKVNFYLKVYFINSERNHSHSYKSF